MTDFVLITFAYYQFIRFIHSLSLKTCFCATIQLQNNCINLLVHCNCILSATTQLALKSLRDANESVFVRKSAQQYLSALLRTSNDQTTASKLFEMLMEKSGESAVLLNSAAAAAVEGGVEIPDELCESFVKIARTRRRAVGDAHWRLTASAISYVHMRGMNPRELF